MARYTAKLTTDSPDSYLCDVVRRREADNWSGTLYVTGELGGGTVTIQGSPDDGTTKATLVDESGSDISVTTASAFNFNHYGNSNLLGEHPKLYVTISGSTAADVDIVLYDNR